jgi:hypothetical protein
MLAFSSKARLNAILRPNKACFYEEPDLGLP